ncbi:MAG: hypothetical protein IPN15_16405 [Saprospiraceae bacterium]|nr:hypothetical protein [Candidatus Vicinibacter affinis]
MNSFTADRFYGKWEGSKKKMGNEVIEQKHFGTFRIPSLCHINWKLKEGDFHWLTLEILQADFQ